MTAFSDQKSQCQVQFSEQVASKNTLTSERNEKDEQHHELSTEFDNKMAICKARVEELLYTDICAVKKVRNEVMKSSTTSPAEKITDCDVKEWVAEQCSVPCDDTCPHM